VGDRVRALVAAAMLVGCAVPPDALDEVTDVIDVRRIEARIEVRRTRDGVEVMRLGVELAGSKLALSAQTPAGRLAIDAVATGPGVPITAMLRAERDGDARSLAITNDLVVIGDTAFRLAVPGERDVVVAELAAGPISAALREVAPYRDAVVARLAEAAPVFVAIGLFESSSGGAAWPALDDPRDLEPPGRLADDVVGLGMTCSSQIRCPNQAPFCVTVDHTRTYGFCTRACLSDAACAVDGGVGRCALSVRDIPDVAVAVLACRVDCLADACPGLLACGATGGTCLAAPGQPGR